MLPFTRELYIDADDFREEANKKYKRLVLGKRVRLRNAYVIEAHEAVKDSAGKVVEVHASIIPHTIGNDPADGVKPKGVIQWVSASRGRQATVRLYDRLFNHEAPDKGDRDFLQHVNPDSLRVVERAWIEPSLVQALPEQEREYLLPRALLAALQRFGSTGNIQDVAGAVHEACDLEAAHLDAELSMIRYIV